MMKLEKQMPPKILIIEDDVSLAFMISTSLEQMGYFTKIAHDGQRAKELLDQNQYQLVLLDIGLPKVNGMEVAKYIREKSRQLPIIVVTSQIEKQQELDAFNTGVNMFHRKPIDFELLEAQINSVFKTHKPQKEIEFGDLKIEPSRRAVSKNGEKVKLSYKEFELIWLLMMNPGEVMTRDQIIRQTFKGVGDPQEGSVDTLVSRLRSKLGEGKSESLIETVHGVGFRLNQEYGEQG